MRKVAASAYRYDMLMNSLRASFGSAIGRTSGKAFVASPLGWLASRASRPFPLTIFIFCAFAAALIVSGAAAAITLAEAQRDMLANNADIALAEAAIEGAAANVIVAGQLQNPTLTVSTAQYSPIGGLGAGRPTDKLVDTIVGISIPIERGDKAGLRRAAALGQLAGARHDLREMQRQQRLSLHQAYYDLKLAEDKRAIAVQTREIAAQALGAADKRVAAGDLAAVDRYRLSVEALRAMNDVISAETEMSQARVALAVVMGRRRERAAAALVPSRAELPVDDLTADEPWPGIQDSAAATSGGAPLLARADVAAADARVAAADAGRGLSHSLRTRDVTVGAQIERVPASSSGLTFGVSMSIPLFARYGFDGEIARAEADYTSALLARRKILSQAEADAAKARAMLEGARRRLTSFEAEIIPAAKKALDAIEFAYTRGASPLTDALDARRTWHSTQLDLANARADHARALAAWLAATRWESSQDH